MQESLQEQLEAVFRQVFDLPRDSDVQGLRQGAAERWDSLGHVMLVAALESEFGVELSIAESIEITSFEAARALLAGRMAEPGP